MPPVGTGAPRLRPAMDSAVQGWTNSSARKGCVTLRKLSLTLAATVIGGLMAMAFSAAPAAATSGCTTLPGGQTALVVAQSGVVVYNNSNLNAQNCNYGLYVPPFTNITLNHVSITGARTDGVYLSYGDTVTLDKGTTIRNSGVWGVFSLGACKLKITGSSIILNGGYASGSQKGGVYAGAHSNVSISYSFIDSNKGYGLDVNNSNVTSWSNQYDSNNFDGVLSENGNGDFTPKPSFKSNGDTLKFNFGNGLKVTGNADVTIGGWDSASGDKIYSNHRDGVVIDFGGNVDIENSSIYANQQNGVEILDSTASISLYSDNIYSNSGTGFVSNTTGVWATLDSVNIVENSIGINLVTENDFANIVDYSYVCDNGPAPSFTPSNNLETQADWTYSIDFTSTVCVNGE